MSENENKEKTDQLNTQIVEVTNQPIKVKVVNNERNFSFPVSSLLFYLAGFFSIGYGFYKMLAYENHDSIYLDNVNAYVGGDAYNYIINSNYFVGFNVLGLTSIIIATSIVITSAINSKRS